MQEPPPAVRRRSGINELGHPTALRYVQIAVILTVLTTIEIAVYYIHSLSKILIPILLTLSAIKFALVVLWYMHLKFDNRIFSALFLLGLIIGGSILIAMILLIRAYHFY
ncbi:MAG TPA: cytochrome C oxidase subunit IV family protein [Chloroflexota bacterium]|nr:cytochrome C oxidase subunit IV family protein [Chloroflexota bacterium]